MTNYEEKIKSLFEKDNKYADESTKTLVEASRSTDCIYPYFDEFAKLLKSKNSFARNRAINLISENAKWDKDNKIDEIIGEYLNHINDEKPITSRQCVKALPLIAKYKPDLKEDIVKKLKFADLSQYKDSMAPLILKDIKEALEEIEKL